MEVNKGEDIIFVLQLVKSDGVSVEDEATVSYRIFDASGTVEVVTLRSATFNSNTQSYMDTLNPSVSWLTQEVGHYLVVWSVTNTDDVFNSVYTEQLNVNIDKVLIDKILGLVHHNIEIDQTVFDTWGNMTAARVRIFKDSLKTQLLTTYQVTCDTTGPGKFSNWEQIEV